MIRSLVLTNTTNLLFVDLRYKTTRVH